MKRLLTILLLLIITSSCVSSFQSQRKFVEIKDDEFESDVTFLGVTQHDYHTGFEKEPTKKYFFRSFLNKENGEIRHQLYMILKYSYDWRFYRFASVSGGDNLEVKEISSDVSSCYQTCSYDEHIGITIPDDYMRDHKKGFRIKVSSKSGHESIIEIPSKLINAQLSSIESSDYYQQANSGS